MRFIGIIPARLGSTRLSRKPLLDICGKPMIQHVYERAKKCLDIVYVATDHAEIFDTVIAFGGKAVMTSIACNSGTDRCWLAYNKIVKLIPYPKVEGLHIEPDIIINIQGDQPLLHHDHIKVIRDCFVNENSLPDIATVAFKLEGNSPWYNKDKAFVVFNLNSEAMYFSRFILPFYKVNYNTLTYQHIGIYGYTVQALLDFCNMEQTPLELVESLEQNRWLENGRKIRVGISTTPSMSVDTKKDLEQVINMIKQTTESCKKHSWKYRGERLDGRFVCEKCGETK